MVDYRTATGNVDAAASETRPPKVSKAAHHEFKRLLRFEDQLLAFENPSGLLTRSHFVHFYRWSNGSECNDKCHHRLVYSGKTEVRVPLGPLHFPPPFALSKNQILYRYAEYGTHLTVATVRDGKSGEILDEADVKHLKAQLFNGRNECTLKLRYRSGNPGDCETCKLRSLRLSESNENGAQKTRRDAVYRYSLRSSCVGVGCKVSLVALGSVPYLCNVYGNEALDQFELIGNAVYYTGGRAPRFPWPVTRDPWWS